MARKATKRKSRIRKTESLGVSRFAAQHGDYRPMTVADPANAPGEGRESMIRLLCNRKTSTVDKWLFEGGPGFEAPEAAAIDHVRRLWCVVGARSRIIGRYDGMAIERARSTHVEALEEGYQGALMALDEYRRQFPPRVWQVFENVVRWDEPAGRAGSRLANTPVEQRAHAKACVGFVASKIAEWRGFLGMVK